MALNIEDATFGYDIYNVERGLNEIDTYIQDDVIGKMESSMDQLNEYVDSAWQGASAEQFKANMRTDKDLVSKQINDSLQAIEDVILTQVAHVINEADENLVSKREA